MKKWAVLRGTHNDNIMIVRLNTGCKEIMGSKKYSYRMGIAIPFLKSQKDGLPSKKEKNNLDLIEDTIFETFQKDNFSVIAVIITTGNMMEFMIYVSDEKLAIKKVNEIGAKHPNYKFQCYVDKDKKWSGYREFLD